ncbi:hypothetical protein [Methanohalobium sp.]|uniref:hypothetical protein n=1 Tax=Methanohalobium sp. TaxID=2837493 RepID=UPI0025EB7F75|nr:hypothetical protein [Methanohalobium sp.]
MKQELIVKHLKFRTLNKRKFIELVEDRMGNQNTNMARKLYHPRIIEFILDGFYSDLITAVYFYDHSLIDVCLDTVYRQEVYKDEKSGNLFCKLPKYVIPVIPYQGGVFHAEKSTDSTVKFEPYNSNFERRNLSRLDMAFVDLVTFWYDRQVDGEVISASGVSLEAYQTLVWFDSSSTSKLEDGDLVNLDILPAFYSYDSEEMVHVPNVPKTSSESILIDMAVRELYRKLGVVTEENEQENKNS